LCPRSKEIAIMSGHALDGKIALVTGAWSERGIGWGIAQAFAEQGADVVLADVTQLDQLELRRQAITAMGRRAIALKCDVTDSAQVDALIAHAVAHFGRLDIVASNAGIIRWENFLDLTPKNVHDVVAVNVLGNVNICRAAARHMIARGGGGKIIVTSSVQSDMNFTVNPIYGASKKAMHALIGSLALELAPHNITINHIGPGWVMTPLNDPSPELQTAEGMESQRLAVPLKRGGTPLEMGRAVAYFAGEDGDYCTGAFLRIDGGLGIGKYSE
jgi:NAD(P)-dependent dehydrogenase (short-subunit alcohol dehydrogenase family)